MAHTQISMGDTIMERMLVVVFENESQANEGAKVLRQLDLDGSIAVYAHAVVVKNPMRL